MMPAPLIWITGLPGSGKTTLARTVAEIWRKTSPAVLLDGDDFRAFDPEPLGHTTPDRRRNAYRLANTAASISNQGVTAIVATVSFFYEIHAHNRSTCPRYLEVYLDASPSLLARRDQRSLYSSGAGLPGQGQPLEFPKHPHLVISADDEHDPALTAQNLIDHVRSAGELPDVSIPAQTLSTKGAFIP